MRPLLSLLVLLTSASLILAADYKTPAPGTALRKELLDVIRVPTKEHLGQDIVFKVNTLRVDGDWAFFVGTATTPNGKPVDFRKSKEYKKDPDGTNVALEAGVLYGGVDALLKKKNGKWQIVQIVFDATDVHWQDYDKEFGAPKSLVEDPIK